MQGIGPDGPGAAPRAPADWAALAARIRKEGGAAGMHPLRIALLSSATLRPLQDVLVVKCREEGISPEFRVVEYGDLQRQILDPAGGVRTFDPDVAVLFVEARTLLGDLYFDPYGAAEKARRGWADRAGGEVWDLVEGLLAAGRATVLVHGLEVPVHSPAGILEPREPFGLHEMVGEVNRRLRERCRVSPRTHFFDYDAFCARIGKDRVSDDRMRYLADLPLDLKHLPALADAYLRYLRPLAGRARKCIVLDLDNTLWGGVLGEEGVAGIRLGPEPMGRPFWEFQRHLAALRARGILLAVCSNNARPLVEQAWREHPHMVLKGEQFAAVRIDWEDKLAKFDSLRAELNLGLGAFVFLDDDPVARARIRQAHPEVLVPDLPADPAGYCRLLADLPGLDVLQVTEEDRRRGDLAAGERRRQEAREASGSLDAFLGSLGMEVVVEEATDFALPRIAQLTQKTNQFNLTTRRYTEADIRTFRDGGRHRVLCARVSDRFGEYGTVGVAIIERSAPAWRIDTFLLSCRVIGRKVEEAILACVARCARREGAARLLGEFRPTAANEPARDFYRRCGFAPVAGGDGAQAWEYDLSRPMPVPDVVRLTAPGLPS